MLALLFLTIAAAPSTHEQAAWDAWVHRGVGVPGAQAAHRAQEEWVKAEPSGKSQVALSRSYFWLATQMHDDNAADDVLLKLYQAGVSAAEEAEKRDPRNAGAYYWHAINLSLTGQIKGAVSSAWMYGTLKSLMDRVDELEPGFAWGATDRFRGVVVTRTPEFLIRMKGGTLDDGERMFEKSLKTCPTFMATYIYWAEMKLRRGDKAAARKMLEQVIAQPPVADEDEEAWNQYEKVIAKRMLQERFK